MIEPEFAFFEVQVEGGGMHALEFYQTCFWVTPETFNAVDVGFATNEFVVAVVNTQVLFVAHVHQAVVAPPTVGMDDRFQAHPATNSL